MEVNYYRITIFKIILVDINHISVDMLKRQKWSKAKVKNRTSNEYNVPRWGTEANKGIFQETFRIDFVSMWKIVKYIFFFNLM